MNACDIELGQFIRIDSVAEISSLNGIVFHVYEFF